jgi:hypothetical protein
VGHSLFGGGGDFDLGVGGEEDAGVAVGVEAGGFGVGGDKVGYDGGGAFALELGAGVFEEVGGLGGESYDEGVGVTSDDGLAENVGGGLEFEV